MSENQRKQGGESKCKTKLPSPADNFCVLFLTGQAYLLSVVQAVTTGQVSITGVFFTGIYYTSKFVLLGITDKSIVTSEATRKLVGDVKGCFTCRVSEGGKEGGVKTLSPFMIKDSNGK